MNPLMELVPLDASPATVSNRRQQERIPISAPVHIVAVSGNPASCEATCRNVSQGGVAFETEAVLDVGKMVEFEFTHRADESCRYYCRILYRDGNRYGAYYVNDDGSEIRPQN